MHVMTASKARTSLNRLMDQCDQTHKPILILGKRTSSVLVSAEDWETIQKALYASSATITDSSVLDDQP